MLTVGLVFASVFTFSHTSSATNLSEPAIALKLLPTVPAVSERSDQGEKADGSPELYQLGAEEYHRLLKINPKPTREAWLNCINLFREVYTQFPSGKKSPEALYMTGLIYKELYFDLKTPEYREKAIHIFRLLARSHAYSTLADDALYLTGEIYFRDGDSANALASYRGLTRWFPKGDLINKAQARIKELAPKEAKTANLATLSTVRFYSGEDYARVVLDLSKIVNYRVTPTKDGQGAEVDLLGAIPANGSGKTVDHDKGMISSLQVTQPDESSVRITLSMRNKNHLEAMELSGPDRLVLDIYGEPEPAEEPLQTAVVTPAIDAPASTPDTALEVPPVPVPETSASAQEASAQGIPVKEITYPEKNLPAGKNIFARKEIDVETVRTEAKQLRTGLDKPVEVEKNKVAALNIDKKSKRVSANKEIPLEKRRLKQSDRAPDPAFLEAGIIPSASPSPKVSATAKAPPPVRTASASPSRSYGIKTVVIDAGHGGKDPGAIGRGGLKEKDVTLDIALRLRQQMKEDCNCRIVMTRTRDEYIALEKRTAIANSVGADLFISIHINAAESRKAEGVETYFLSPARSKRAMYTAARENMVKQSKGDEQTDDINFIFSDMQNTNKINESNRMASEVQNSLVKKLNASHRTKDLGVKSAMFYVLHGARMPAVLVEASFISNAEEEKRLKTASFRQKVAEGIASGVRDYATGDRLAMAR